MGKERILIKFPVNYTHRIFSQFATNDLARWSREKKVGLGAALEPNVAKESNRK